MTKATNVICVSQYDNTDDGQHLIDANANFDAQDKHDIDVSSYVATAAAHGI